ncbi:DUF473 domain-containing protein [Thermococcus waiotapuensis]|uniref:DUF473 family protein n=1 Tax=Thermococcus waiotapuensis TaxID=90909 RepID=A0AAE4NWM4_9EURY|nr:DUF473 family protein [Thermococcus waiotapuensis]MDV3104666.1 DUF473 family protein [Thermococcus waiotapuensis]
MEAVVIAGIARRVLDDLLRNPFRTVELRSARNILAVEEALDEALRLFLTYDPFEDVSTGTEGLLAELIEAREINTRIPWEESDEREVTVCRARVKLVGLGRVVEVERKDGILVAKVRELFPHEMSIG